ncbi:MAG: triose-phosphate isomerase [Microgenomates group bacterium]
MILINFKIYKETFGDGAVKLAKIVKKVADETKIRMVVVASALDAVRIIQETGAEVWLQNVDEYNGGKATGWTSMDQARMLGIKGSLVNHSEHKKPKGTVLKIIKGKPDGFEICLCMGTLGQIEKWGASGKPDWIMYEPPSLIGSKDKSISSEEPKMIKNAVEMAKGIKLIAGAGIKSKADVEVCLKMGAVGVVSASDFVLAKDPEKELRELASGFNGII